jgi:hypothetical protein
LTLSRRKVVDSETSFEFSLSQNEEDINDDLDDLEYSEFLSDTPVCLLKYPDGKYYCALGLIHNSSRNKRPEFIGSIAFAESRCTKCRELNSIQNILNKFVKVKNEKIKFPINYCLVKASGSSNGEIPPKGSFYCEKYYEKFTLRKCKKLSVMDICLLLKALIWKILHPLLE